MKPVIHVGRQKAFQDQDKYKTSGQYASVVYNNNNGNDTDIEEFQPLLVIAHSKQNDEYCMYTVISIENDV